MIFFVTMVVWGFVSAETALITLAVLTVTDWYEANMDGCPMKNPPAFCAFWGAMALTAWVIAVWMVAMILTPAVWGYDRLREVARGK